MPSPNILLGVGWGSAALAAQLTLAHLVGICGFESGVEFSPDTFQIRNYRTYRWGPVEFPRVETPGDDSLRRYLLAKGHIEADPAEVRWVYADRRRPNYLPLGCSWGPSEPLGRALFELENDERWLREWSESDPELAKAFWSKLIAWMREGKHEEAQMLLYEFRETSSMEQLEEQFDDAERLVANFRVAEFGF